MTTPLEDRVKHPTRRLGRLTALTAALAGAVVATASTTGSNAFAGPTTDAKPASPATRAVAPEGPAPAGFASWRDLLATQERLLDAATRLDGSVRGRTGFTGIELAVPERQVRLYWHGAVPAEVTATVAGLRDRAGVAVKPARHSRRQLEAARARLTGRAGTAASVVRVGVPADGRGLEVAVQGSAARARGSLRSVVGDVRLEVTGGEPARSLYSRVDDAPAFWGGARTTNGRTGGGCSTGFAIASRATGQRSILTAGHCALNGDIIYTGTRRYAFGTATDRFAAQDTLRIPANTAGRVYDGGVGVGEFSKPVAGAVDTFPGLWLCTSGSYSGARCNIVTRGVNEWINTDVGPMGPLSRAEEVNRQSAAGQGDSGGPVFALTSDFSRMIAAGTISAGDLAGARATCTGVQGRLCSWRIWFADVADALARYNSAIVLG
jgi:hypothetical protein